MQLSTAIRYVSNKDIDYQKWDQCIHEAHNGTIYALSWYLDSTAPGWDAVVQADSDSYGAVFPIPTFQKFGLIKIINEPPFVNQLGLISRSKRSPEELRSFLQLLRSRFRFCNMLPLNCSNTELFDSHLKEQLAASDIDVQFLPSYELNLSTPYIDIFNKYTNDRKKNLARSMKHGLILEKTGDIEELIYMFRNHTASRIYGGVSQNQYALLKTLFVESHKRNMSEIFRVRYGNKTLASSLFLLYKNRVIKFFNSSTTEGRVMNADTFLTNEVIKMFSGQNRIFDFERGSLEGINHYKKSFGTTLSYYPAISFNRLPYAVALVRDARKRLIQHFRSGLPPGAK